MIAALPMYDWPETRAANDEIWRKFAVGLAELGFEAPSALTRDHDLMGIWLSENLMMAQTCSYPLETVLRGKVKYVATPSYHVEGCEQPGTYRSVILKRGSHSNMQVPTQNAVHLPDWASDDVVAINDKCSMSGFHALLRDAEIAERSLPDKFCFTGSHRASIIAVASGDANLAAVDCVSWSLAQIHESAAQDVYVAGWTKVRPGLPLVTSIKTEAALLNALQSMSISLLHAVILGSPTEK